MSEQTTQRTCRKTYKAIRAAGRPILVEHVTHLHHRLRRYDLLAGPAWDIAELA
jgi:hypothetical protein